MNEINLDLIEQQRKQAKDHYDRNEEYRRDVAQHSDPLMKWARQTDKSAIDLGLSIFKTTTLLNGGAIIALPAVIALFGVDAQKAACSLLWAGGCFALGLFFSGLSAMCGFFSLANRADREVAESSKIKWEINLAYFPPDESETGVQRRKEANQEIAVNKQKMVSFFTAFFRWRLAAILLSFLSLFLFVGGNVIGGYTVLHAPDKISVKAAPENQKI